jgi:hypothetical protein
MSYDTPLKPNQAAAYQQWRLKLPNDLRNTADYDLQGAYLAAMQADGRLHMGDQFKKPNHMTFSDGSQYSTPQKQGGHWSNTGIPNPANPNDGQYVFWASPYNVSQHPIMGMQDYFRAVEPGNTAIYNIPYILRPRNGQ